VGDPDHPWIEKRYEYDADGRMVALHREISRGQFASYRFQYDPAGQLVEQVGPEGERTIFTYDGRGLVVEVALSPGTPEELIHRYGWDANGNEIAYSDPEGHRVEKTSTTASTRWWAAATRKE